MEQILSELPPWYADHEKAAGKDSRKRRRSGGILGRKLRSPARDSVGAMLIRRGAAVTASASLLALAVLHAAWGAGSAWPLRDRRTLADAVIGAGGNAGPALCFAASGALATAGALVAG
jgi:hypothetical protein